jgi:protein-disulfide isomerase
MKPSVVVALLIGAGIGFGIGMVVRSPSQGGSTTTTATGTPTAAAPTSEDALAYKSHQMPAGILDALTPAQKVAAMTAANSTTCSDCPSDTVAKCLTNHATCNGGQNQLRRMAELAKQNKSSREIAAALGGAAPAQAAAPAAQYRKVDAPADSPSFGPSNAKVTIVEFSDYYCPFCARVVPTLAEIKKTYGNDVRVVFRHQLRGSPPEQKQAAEASMAAHAQGKFWEYHDKLFENMQARDRPALEKIAQDLKLDMNKFRADLDSKKFAAKVQADSEAGGAAGANGTPTFFINGRQFVGAQPFASFKTVIDEELARANKLLAEGTRPEQVYQRALDTAPLAAVAPPRPQAPPAAVMQKVDVPADTPVFGPKNAKVTIVEFSDFYCPFCSRVVPTLEEIKKTYGKDVRVAFRHQLRGSPPEQKQAHEASMAAHAQGKFWEYHDKLFENMQARDRAALEKIAQDLKLDMNKFRADLDSKKFAAKVQADSAAGSGFGANGTPTFFINGRQFVGAQPFPAFKAVIDEELARADKLLAEGTKPDQLYERLLATAQAPAAAPIAPAAPAEPAVVKDIQLAQAPVKGPKNAPVTIVAFSDFECPFCSRVVPTLSQLEQEYKGKIKVAFKHQPLPFHANAKIAAAASMAANEQGKFWEYHDKLFQNQKALDRTSLERYAEELKLDMGKFRSVLDSNKYDALIAADSAEGSRIGANGTPTFFINGRTLVGAQPVGEFKRVIDEELKKAGK